MKNLKPKFIGSLVGLAIGDFLGAGGRRYTDDTAMAIGVAESLIEKKGFDGEHMASVFVKNYEAEPWRGYGPGPPKIFKMIKAGKKWNEKLDQRLYPKGSFGNGAAMRVAPIGLFYYDNFPLLKEVATYSSIITHSHPLGIEGAILEAYAVALAVKAQVENFEREEFIRKLINLVKEPVYKEKLKRIQMLLKGKAAKSRVIRQLGNGIEAFNSVPISIYSFVANEGFESTLNYALSLGGDRDTISAMTGAIAGAFYGIEEIPKRWRMMLERGEYIEKLAERLWETKVLGGER